MRRIILESPYAGDIRRNVAYARLCLKDAIQRREAPLASHLLYTQILDDSVPFERRLGIRAGLEWMKQAEAVVLYRDFGISRGMLAAMCEAQALRIPIENRWLGAVNLESSLRWRWWHHLVRPDLKLAEAATLNSARQEAKASAENLE